MKRKILFSLLVNIVLVFYWPLTVWGFDSKGHKAIESAAYELLKYYPGIGPIPNGLQILNFFTKNNMLAGDLNPHSQFPDLSLERQFAQNRQMYHFMASNHDVMQASRSNGEELQQQQLLLQALPPCLKMIYFFFRETIDNYEGASQAGRGIYVIMHIVADSYSSEHTSRDISTNQLVTVKGWRLSRLWWPRSAKTRELGKETLRLLHNSFNTPGDHNWEDVNTTSKLSPLADSAAHALMDLLIAIYMAMKSPKDVDSIIGVFFQQHFRPLGSSITGNAFTFNNTREVIFFTFDVEYNRRPNKAAFDYDRFPQHATMFSLQPGLSTNPLPISFGIEYSKFITPHTADDSKVFLKRLPWGYGISISEITERQNGFSFAEVLRLKGFLSISLALPLVNATLNPHAGMGLYPFSNSQYFSFAGGFDLVWNIGRDWVIPGSTTTRNTRFSLGYEYDRWNLITKKSIALKIGFNTWHARVVFRHSE